jgi:hypothetical protein
MPGGRPTDYSAEMLEKANDYIANPTSYEDVVPTVAGLAVALGVSKKTLYNWGDRDDAFLHALERLMTKQERELVTNGLTSIFNPVITKLMMQNHNYSDKQEITGKDGAPLINDAHKEKATAAIRQITGGANPGAGE